MILPPKGLSELAGAVVTNLRRDLNDRQGSGPKQLRSAPHPLFSQEGVDWFAVQTAEAVLEHGLGDVMPGSQLSDG